MEEGEAKEGGVGEIALDPPINEGEQGGDLDLSAVRTRSDLQSIINNSISPFFVKKELLDYEEEQPDLDPESMEVEMNTAAGGSGGATTLGAAEQGITADKAAEDDVDLADVVLKSKTSKAPLHNISEDEEETDTMWAVRNLFKTTTPYDRRARVEEKVVEPILDHRYHTVKGLRMGDGQGRELNTGYVGQPSGTGSSLLVEGDCRLLYNSNSFRMEKTRNVSRSFDAENDCCVTCPANKHAAYSSKNKLPVVFALSDQNFSPNIPVTDGGECIRVLRIENGRLKELTGEFITTLKERNLAAGSVILLGSITQLEKDGTAQYAEDWHKCRAWIREDLGELMVLPLIPMPMEDISDESTVRSLIEFLSWFADLPEAEVRLLKETRDHFTTLYLARMGGGAGNADSRQSFKMPLSLSGMGKMRYVSRGWGQRPNKIAAFTLETERYWALRLINNLNSDFNLSLSTNLGMFRSAQDVARLGAVASSMDFAVVGASNAGRLAEALAACDGVKVTDLATPGWRLASDRVPDLVVRLEQLPEETAIVLYGLDNSCFVSVDEDLRSGPPFRGRDGRYHLHGKLAVVSGFQLDNLLSNLKSVLTACGKRQVTVVCPVPRFWLRCCDKQDQGTVEVIEQDRKRVLREINKLRKGIISLTMRLRMSSRVHVLNPMEVLGAGEDIEAVQAQMLDTVHLNPTCYFDLADSICKVAGLWKAGKRMHESGPAGPPAKYFKSGRGESR